MASTRSPRFTEILESARERNSGDNVETMVVTGHMAQQRMFMLRGGIEFYPKQDTFGHRKIFLHALITENEIDARLEGVADDFLLDGKGIWFFRPVRDSYRISWFPYAQYRAFYDAMDEMEELRLIYPFKVESSLRPPMMPGAAGSTEQWVKLVVRRDSIHETICFSRPSLDDSLGMNADAFGRSRVVRNSLGFIPAIEAFNNMKSTGHDATNDFDWLENQICRHDGLVANISENIRFFGNPTLLSSRPKTDLMVATEDGAVNRPTIASQAGFSSASEPSTRRSTPGGLGGGRERGWKIPRLIANLEPTDRVAYATPDAVSGDQNLYARQYREELRGALGGVDELGISSGATVYEIKSLYGRAATTAARKCRGLLTYGLCKLLGLIIHHEERVFRDSFAAALKLKRPMPPIQEEVSDPKVFRKAAEAFDEGMAKFEAKLEAKIREAVQATTMPPGVMGLIPDGDRTVQWRWRGPVFEDTTEDKLNRSIVVRNLQELGVASIEALRELFPDRTDEERAAMLSGYPFRMAQQTQQSIGSFLGLIAQMQQTPHPQSPDLPLLADPRLDLTPYLYRALDFLKRELTYAGTYRDSTGSGDPAGLNALERFRSERGLPASPVSPSPIFLPDTGAAAGGASGDAAGLWPTGAPGQPMGSGPAGTVRLADRDAQLPSPGSALAADPVGTGLPSGSSSFGANGPDGGSGPVPAARLPGRALPGAGGGPDPDGAGVVGGDPFTAGRRTAGRPVPQPGQRRKP